MRKFIDEGKKLNQLLLSKEEIDEIEEIIIFTADHTQKNEKIDKSLNAQVFLDYDLSILGYNTI